MADFKLYYTAVAIKTVWSRHKHRHGGPWNGTEIPEVGPQLYGQLIFDKAGKNIDWEKTNLFNKWEECSYERNPTELLGSLPPCEDAVRSRETSAACLQLGRELSPEPDLPGPCSWTCSLRTEEQICVAYWTPGLWSFVTAAHTD